VSCFITVKLWPLTLQQNINENLTYQTVRKPLIKVALSLNFYLPSFFRAKLVNSKNDQKNAPECDVKYVLYSPFLWGIILLMYLVRCLQSSMRDH